MAGLVLLGALSWNLLSQKGPQDLPGNFRELAEAKNENNTGPVHRRYLVSVSDTLWKEMMQYGQFMPYTKLGRTEVYFMREGTAMSAVIELGDPAIPEAFQGDCLGRYVKNAMGASSLIPYPFGRP